MCVLYTYVYLLFCIGRYVVDIKYAEMPIMGSPFYPEVFDPYQVRVGRIPIGFIGKPVMFDGMLLLCCIGYSCHKRIWQFINYFVELIT